MSNKISIKIKKIQYSGDTIGEEIRIETQVLDQYFGLDRIMKHGSTVEVDREIANFPLDGESFSTLVNIKVIEKDFLFNDVGNNSANFQINTKSNKLQEFNIEVRVREKSKIFRKSTAVFTITLEAQVFEQSNVIPRSYQSRKHNEHYDRFDREIAQVVDFWNKEFSQQDLPPPILLDSNLVKAMMYIESRIGYGLKSGGYDVMQVGNPKDPALHTLNNDGWVNPKTGKVAREYEWQQGSIKLLDYTGEANAKTTHESIKWGVRWLYHKAQKIQDNKRVWRTWKEAVLGYGPGKKSYQNNVWRIYTQGIDQHGNKLRLILLVLLVTSGLFFGRWAVLNQGETFVTFKDIEGTANYKVEAHILNGLWFQHIPLTITYANAGNWLALDRKQPVVISDFDIDKDGQQEILISGAYLGAYSTGYLLKKEKGKYRIVYHRSEEGDIKEAFSADAIDFRGGNDDSRLEAVEENYLAYSNAPDQVWSTYYFFDPVDGIYKFSKKDKKNCPCDFSKSIDRSKMTSYKINF